MSLPRVLSSRAQAAAIASLCLFGLAIRLPGLTSRDLWFDDSWAALPAHASLHDALRMVVTTPLYTLAMRTWIGVVPQDTWWAQLPALVLGVVGIAAVWGLVRAYGYSKLAAFCCASVVAAGPTTVAYSTRVKEYSADLLVACLVLWLVERWRRAPSKRALAQLGVVAVAGLWISASTAAVIGGAAAVTVLLAWSNPALRRQVAGFLVTLLAGAASVWLVFLRHLPGQLRTNWRTHGYLFGYSSARHVAYAFQQSFAGIAHGLLGIPIPYTFQGFELRAVPLGLAIGTAVLLGLVVAPPLVRSLRTKDSSLSPTTAAAAAVVIAILGTLSGIAPFGDGRTDEALYPAILLVGVGAASLLVHHVDVAEATRRAGRLALVVALAAVAIWFGVSHEAAYPPTGLRTVYDHLKALLRPGDLVVVDGYEQFTWGDEGLTPWHVSLAQGAIPWPMGFHVASDDPSVDLSDEYLQPDPRLPALVARASRIWFIGPTVGGYSTSAPKVLWVNPIVTPTVRVLETSVHCGGLGLLPASTFFEYSGAYLQLYVHPRPGQSAHRACRA